MPGVVETVDADHIPVALDHPNPARRAVGALPVDVVHVACVGVADTVGQRDAPRPAQRVGRGGWPVEHLEVGMERGEVHRHIRAEVLDHPGGHGVELGVGVVEPWDE